MKHLCVILLAVISVSIYAQPNKHRNNMLSNYAFQQAISIMNSKPDDAQKLEYAKKIVSDNKIMSEQVKKLAELFSNDNGRLEFTQSAYANTADKEHFYEVYNAFSYFSTVFRLHDYVIEQRGGSNTEVEIPTNNVMTFPAIEYPDYRKYFGKIGCTNIISDQDFMSLAERVFKENSEDRKLALANNISYSNCMQTAQAMKVASLLQNESSRMDFLKNARAKVFDPDNYKYAMPLFTTNSYKQELNNLIGGPATDVTNDIPPCETNQKDFFDLKNAINRQGFTNTKVNVAKQLIKDKKCFKTDQIIELLTIFPTSEAKLDIAKYSYDYTTDKENYAKIADSLPFSSDKASFLNFLRTKN